MKLCRVLRIAYKYALRGAIGTRNVMVGFAELGAILANCYAADLYDVGPDVLEWPKVKR